MPDQQYPCPECGTVLRPKNPLTAGKKIKCPKCATIFAPVAVDGVTARPAKGARRPVDEDDEGGTYGFNQADDKAEESTEEERKKAMAPLKVRSKSSRGPAQAAVTPPSNKMLGTAVITCVGCVITIIAMLWPLIFHSNKKPDELTQKTSNKKWVEETSEQKTERIVKSLIIIAFSILAFLYNGVVALGAVRMQSLESYSWAMIGSILIMLPFNWGLAWFAFLWFTKLVTAIAGPEIGLMLTLATIGGVSLFYVYVGLWNFKTLRSEEVLAGFREEKPEDF